MYIKFKNKTIYNSLTFSRISYSKTTFILLLFVVCSLKINAQNSEVTLPKESVFQDPVTKYWINTYGNIRISKKLFWVAQTHFRFQEDESTPFVGQIAQVYNRHALGYIYTKKINFALGGVLRLNFDTKDQSKTKTTIPEYRIWHQYQFAMPVGIAISYHRFRIEHRWSKSFKENSEYIFRNRWRYMFRLKIPVNKPKIQSGAFYVAPEAELILQSGKKVIDSPLEDLRLHTSFGYIFSPKLTVAAGIMYNQGQELNNGGLWKQGWTFRTHLYFSPDFRNTKNKLPEVHFRD
ncbi:DUF2490 domain-containing protein [Aquimarina agarivorans]|uniref:DUF2490 domain-containing protein n=1 Tax=Aquimarina agarivorans TaxID=980584 RepID=UPI000248E7B5|nr:DUF2490 domain-containing protein [Aquimarina agarivorans]